MIYSVSAKILQKEHNLPIIKPVKIKQEHELSSPTIKSMKRNSSFKVLDRFDRRNNSLKMLHSQLNQTTDNQMWNVS